MTYFTNPVPGVIHPKSWVRPAGNIEFKNTRTCADHKATGQGCAIDIGNGRCDGKVLASAAGVVTFRQDLQGIVRIQHADGWRTDYSHMFPILVKVGAIVTQGQQIGEVSDAHDPAIPNFSGCHLHYNILLNGVQQDPWPYMNVPPPLVGEDVLQGTFIRTVENDKVFTTASPEMNFRSSPYVKTDNIIGKLPTNTELHPDFVVAGTKVGAAANLEWYGAWWQSTKGWEFGYASLVFCTVPVPIEKLGHTDQELADARAEGISDAAEAAAAVK
jgi:hypothetical protein